MLNVTQNFNSEIGPINLRRPGTQGHEGECDIDVSSCDGDFLFVIFSKGKFFSHVAPEF